MYYIYPNIRWLTFSFFSGKYPYNTWSAFLPYIWVNTAYTNRQNNKTEQMDSQGINAHIMTPCNMVSALLKSPTRTLSFVYQSTWCHNKYGNFVYLRKTFRTRQKFEIKKYGNDGWIGECDKQMNKTFCPKTCSVAKPADFSFNHQCRLTVRFLGAEKLNMKSPRH